ncbi:uncharacterized protein LOC118745622 [Rhagoletis pomonella]|uniref:uncharacterized protein LOC118745622 n=1 Tax=Rhagoletis pomonella TaxID=28610 RepID=UPI001783F48F|nr:uncharacterized protein LOC118745622 [Rhagoletis pomonella]
MQDNQIKRSTNEKKSKGDIICYNCRKTGHISRECSEKKQKPKCGKCGEIGHRITDCTGQKQKSEKCNAIEDEPIKFTVKKVLVHDNEIEAFVDTGSSRSLVRNSVAANIEQCLMEKCYVRLKGFGGGVFECYNKIHVMMKIDNASVCVHLLVVDDNLIENDIPLGRDVLCSGENKYIIDGDTV